MNEPKCAYCGKLNCMQSAPASGPPDFCPMQNFSGIISSTIAEYKDDPQKSKLALAAARVEGEGYGRWSRVEETIIFARKIGAKKIGIATCIGLLKESQMLMRILEENEFEPVSVCCKTGGKDKTEIGLKQEEKIAEGFFEAICNPVAQARILNEVGTDMNIIMGLCVGHDMLFLKEAKAPTTVLVVKDRVTGHNPAAALYTSHFYYRKLFSV
ncbi:DUF1847 domain-containing protein [Candidatus Poribacteria bacterium]|nr:DUF1847 domain-containing protein [Candidatus Poribacteria bacterium]